MSANLTPGQWYRDPETEHWFKLLSVQEQTVEITDRQGNRRVVNRIRWEADMEPVS